MNDAGGTRLRSRRTPRRPSTIRTGDWAREHVILRKATATMNRDEILTSDAGKGSLTVAGALAANGEDDDAYWDLVQKLRHKYGRPLLTEAEVQTAIQGYYALTRAQHPLLATVTNSDALQALSSDRRASATRADQRAVVVVEATLSIDSAITLEMVQETDKLLTQLGTSLERLYHKHLLSNQLVALIDATGYRLAEQPRVHWEAGDGAEDQQRRTREGRDGKAAQPIRPGAKTSPRGRGGFQ